MTRICTTELILCIKHKQGEPTVLHKELYSVLCDDLTDGKEIQKRGDIRMADSLCGTAENSTTL